MSETPDTPKATTYWDYIKLQELLSLQGGLEDDESGLSQDEVVFISVHQVSELWFKLVLRDIVAARGLFAGEHVPDDALAGACRMLRRIRSILEIATHHFQLVESITTRDYLDFRDKLFPANGGQSVQFREVEIMMGLEDSERIPFLAGKSYQAVLQEPGAKDGWVATRAKERLADRPNLREAVDSWLYRTPIDGSTPDAPDDEARVSAYLEAFLSAQAQSMEDLAQHVKSLAETDAERAGLTERYASEAAKAAAFMRAEEVENPEERARRRRIRAAILFIETHRELPLLSWPREILDSLIGVEQAFVTFRQRHARMAERVIGRRVGTGGSSGVDYLDQVALAYRVFGDLWGVRTLLVRQGLSPKLSHEDYYSFRVDGD